MNFDNLTEFVNVPYILAVFFLTEMVKKFFPDKAKGYRKYLTLIVASAAFTGFVGWEIMFGVRTELVHYTQKVLLSFPGIVTFYDYLAKPILSRLKGGSNAE